MLLRTTLRRWHAGLGILAVAVGSSALPALAQGDAANPDTPAFPPLREWSRQTRGLRSVGARMPQGLGAIASDDEAFTRNNKLRVVPAKRGERPTQVILTDYLPPVGMQGQQGSCVAWSSGYYCYSYEIAKQLRLTPEQMKDPRWIFSPAYLYNQGNSGRDNGMPVARGFELLRDTGCATLAEMPYDESDFKNKPSDNARKRGQKYKAPKIAHLFRGKFVGGTAPDLDKLRTFLADTQQPFVMAIPIFTDFPNGDVKPDFIFNTAVDTKNRENFYGLHAITVVGYDEDKKAFRMVNSWGPNWGDKGFLWLADDFVLNYAVEGWASTPGGPLVRTPKWKNVEIVPPDAKDDEKPGAADGSNDKAKQ